MYEDDNETYAYEKDQRATYDLAWNEKTRTLTMGARQSSVRRYTAARGQMGHKRSDIVDAIYAHALPSGMASVAERVTSRALGRSAKTANHRRHEAPR